MDKTDVLDDLTRIKALDKSGMLSVVAGFPDMLLGALNLSPQGKISPKKKIRQIIISGMGGSAIAGDIVATIIQGKTSIPLLVNRSYKPATLMDQATVFLAVSYSGNTEETLSATKEAIKQGAKVVCIASGGELKKIAQKKKLPFFLIPEGFQPRAALPYLLVSSLKAVSALGVADIRTKDLQEAVSLLQKLKKEYCLESPLHKNLAKQMAKKMLGKTPLIFATTGTTDVAALRFKTQLNENSKTLAFTASFPELNHNEVVALSALKRGQHKFYALLLRDSKDLERMKKRMEITKSLIGNQVGGVCELYSKGSSSIARLLSLVFLVDFISVYLAILQGVDPTPVEAITRLKKELKR